MVCWRRWCQSRRASREPPALAPLLARATPPPVADAAPPAQVRGPRGRAVAPQVSSRPRAVAVPRPSHRGEASTARSPRGGIDIGAAEVPAAAGAMRERATDTDEAASHGAEHA